MVSVFLQLPSYKQEQFNQHCTVVTQWRVTFTSEACFNVVRHYCDAYSTLVDLVVASVT